MFFLGKLPVKSCEIREPGRGEMRPCPLRAAYAASGVLAAELAEVVREPRTSEFGWNG